MDREKALMKFRNAVERVNVRKQEVAAIVNGDDDRCDAAGCIVHENNHAAILLAANLTPEQGRAIVTQMMERGEAVPLDDDLQLKTSGGP